VLIKITAFTVAAILSVSPILILENIPLVDAPNHLARFHILNTLSSDSHLSTYYFVKGGFFPYNGMRIMFALFTPLVGVEGAGRIFAVVAVLLPLLASMALSFVIHKRLPMISIAVFAFSMNMLAGWGFLNFLFSVGIVILAFAAWIALDACPYYIRYIIFCTIVFMVGAIHLISSGILVGLIIVYELAKQLQLATGLRDALQVIKRVAPLVLFATPVLILVKTISAEELGTPYTEFGHPLLRLEMLISPLVLGLGSSRIEPLVGIIVGLLLYVAIRAGFVRPKRPFGLMLIIMALAAAVAPISLWGVAVLHIRLPLLIILVLIAALELNLTHQHRNHFRVLSFTAATMAAFHLTLSGFVLWQQDRRIAELRRASEFIARGSKVLPVINTAASRQYGAASQKSLLHIASYLIIDRSVFLPTFFGYFEVGVKPALKHQYPSQGDPIASDLLLSSLREPENSRASVPPWALIKNYDYLVLYDQGSSSQSLPGTKIIHFGSYFKILEVLHDEPRKISS
jgi:hypothetical protein